jgi:histidinol-phosphate phosphatase family protein
MIKPDKSWTLFLDRDGVINYEKEADYIHTWDEFKFYPDVPEAIAALSHLFGLTIIVTNQKGIGKGVTLQENVETIHKNMALAVEKAGGKIDAVYFCPDTNDNSPCRKPNPGMAFWAKNNFPTIDFSKSLMVGNKLSDLRFGRNAGMHTAFVRTTHPNTAIPDWLADLVAEDLPHLSHLLRFQQP